MGLKMPRALDVDLCGCDESTIYRDMLVELADWLASLGANDEVPGPMNGDEGAEEMICEIRRLLSMRTPRLLVCPGCGKSYGEPNDSSDDRPSMRLVACGNCGWVRPGDTTEVSKGRVLFAPVEE